MDIQSILMLAAFVVVCFAMGLPGAFIRPGGWYERLAKPSWRPPNRIFAPVWSTLYLMIAISGWLVWRERGFAGAAVPLGVYGVQLVLNASWTPIFFGAHRIGLGLIEIVLVWVSIALTIALFAPIQAAAAWLLVPYLAWGSFATALNFAIWRLNPAPRPKA